MSRDPQETFAAMFVMNLVTQLVYGGMKRTGITMGVDGVVNVSSLFAPMTAEEKAAMERRRPWHARVDWAQVLGGEPLELYSGDW